MARLEREPSSVPPAYFNEAQAEQALWQEFRDRGASLNNALKRPCGSMPVLRGRSSRCVFSSLNLRFSLSLLRLRVS
jgi:hypothetical protein